MAQARVAPRDDTAQKLGELGGRVEPPPGGKKAADSAAAAAHGGWRRGRLDELLGALCALCAAETVET